MFPFLRNSFFLCLLLTISTSAFAQTDTLLIKGKITNDNQTPLSHIMIINKRAGIGVFAAGDGTFRESFLRTDTIIISSVGYTTQYISFVDSAKKNNFNINIKLGAIKYKLKEVSIYPTKTLNQVDKQISEIGVKPTNTYNDINGLESPITYLYERFSKFERSKRLVAQLENEDRKRAALKDLFRIYIKYDIIYLTDEQFDEFVDYCDLKDEFILHATQYELTKAIQVKFKGYEFSHPAK